MTIDKSQGQTEKTREQERARKNKPQAVQPRLAQSNINM